MNAILTDTSTTDILLHQQDGILEISLNRPKANAIDRATSRRLGEIFTAFRDST